MQFLHGYKVIDSNTTLVKVKLDTVRRIYKREQNSNTTLVKVKYHFYNIIDNCYIYSNTTLVKVKLVLKDAHIDYVNLFKYNTC